MKMFTAAKSDEQRVAAANAIWMLLFCDDNKILFKEIKGAADEIYKCIVSNNFFRSVYLRSSCLK